MFQQISYADVAILYGSTKHARLNFPIGDEMWFLTIGGASLIKKFILKNEKNSNHGRRRKCIREQWVPNDGDNERIKDGRCSRSAY
jgi:hypothetical protein